MRNGQICSFKGAGQGLREGQVLGERQVVTGSLELRAAPSPQKHIKEHHEEVRERPCPHPGCNKVFMIDRYLQRHVKLIHTGVCQAPVLGTTLRVTVLAGQLSRSVWNKQRNCGGLLKKLLSDMVWGLRGSHTWWEQ